jgi:hypothetical protein
MTIYPEAVDWDVVLKDAEQRSAPRSPCRDC